MVLFILVTIIQRNGMKNRYVKKGNVLHTEFKRRSMFALNTFYILGYSFFVLFFLYIIKKLL